jgi:hypothetical protein
MVSSIIEIYAVFFLMNHREHRGKEENTADCSAKSGKFLNTVCNN